METAEFEEKQYEYGLTTEIAAGSTAVFPAGQVLEATLGYDIALDPGSTKIWAQLGSGPPPGVLLTPSLWQRGAQPPSGKLPPRLISLILQVKRPQWLDHWRAGQHHRWMGPYYRFYVDDPPGQQQVLDDLEQAIGGRALVRYAAAAFLSYSDLCQFQAHRQIGDHSTFVAPDVLRGHRLWSYDGAGTTGYANPEGEDGKSDSIETLLATAREQSIPESLSDHVRALADQQDVGDRVGGEWIADLLPRALQADEGMLARASDWATFATAVARTGGSWLVLGFDS